MKRDPLVESQPSSYSRVCALEEQSHLSSKVTSTFLAEFTCIRADIRSLRRRESTPQLALDKSSLQIPREDYDAQYPHLDYRYALEDDPAPFGRSFSKTFLKYPQGEGFAIFFLIHHKDILCPIGEPCDHWLLYDMEFTPDSERHIAFELLCVSDEGVARGIVDIDNPDIEMFDDEDLSEKRINCQPCHVFNALKPNFKLVNQEGYQVISCSLCDGHGEPFKTNMDQYGRLLARM